MKTTTILNASKELTARERIQVRKGANALSLKKELDKLGTITATPDFYATLQQSDENGEIKTLLIFHDKESNQYFRTGSQVFIQDFMTIWDELSGVEENFQILCKAVQSRTSAGKYLACDLV